MSYSYVIGNWGQVKAMDNHRGRPVRHHAAFARGVLTSYMNRLGYLVRHGFLQRVGKKLNPSTNRPAFIHVVNTHPLGVGLTT